MDDFLHMIWFGILDRANHIPTCRTCGLSVRVCECPINSTAPSLALAGSGGVVNPTDDTSATLAADARENGPDQLADLNSVFHDAVRNKSKMEGKS